MTTAVRTEIRGQCEKGHVLIAETFGPQLPESWMCSCPLPDCGFDITWECRPAWVTGHGPLQPLVAARKACINSPCGPEYGDALVALLAEAVKLADAVIEKETGR